MINPFHINVTLGKWLFTPDCAPFEVVNEKNMLASIDPAKIPGFAHQAALLDAYPDYIEDLGIKVANNSHMTIMYTESTHGTVSSRASISVQSDPHIIAPSAPPEVRISWIPGTGITDNYEQTPRGGDSSTDSLTKSKKNESKTRSRHDPHDLTVFITQLEHLHIPIWSLPSHLQYLFSRFYYSVALKTIKQDSSPMWAFPLVTSWALYRVADAARFAVGLVVSPVPFALTLVLRSAVAGARLVGTWGHYAIANASNSIAQFFSTHMENFGRKAPSKANYSWRIRPITAADIKDANIDGEVDIIIGAHNFFIVNNDGNPTHIAERKPITSPSRLRQSRLHQKKIMDTPDLADAWTDFLERLRSAWKDSTAYFNPIFRKANVILHHIDKNIERPQRDYVRNGAIFFMLCAWAFIELVALEFISRGVENRPFDTNVLDYVGGGYAKIIGHAFTLSWDAIAMAAVNVWNKIAVFFTTFDWSSFPKIAEGAGHYIASGLSPSWDKIEVGMKFFGYFLTQNAFVLVGIVGFLATMGAILYKAAKGNEKGGDKPMFISAHTPAWTAPPPSASTNNNPNSHLMLAAAPTRATGASAGASHSASSFQHHY